NAATIVSQCLITSPIRVQFRNSWTIQSSTDFRKLTSQSHAAFAESTIQSHAADAAALISSQYTMHSTITAMSAIIARMIHVMGLAHSAALNSIFAAAAARNTGARTFNAVAICEIEEISTPATTRRGPIAAATAAMSVAHLSSSGLVSPSFWTHSATF